MLSKHVRLIEESIDNKQANCVDGSVLLASILRKIDIHPFLVTVPGHMYLGFQLDKDGEVPIAIETTMIGSKEVPEPPVPDEIKGLVRAGMFDDRSFKTFFAALAAARADLEANAEKIDGEDPAYQTTDIAAAREMKVMPSLIQRRINQKQAARWRPVFVSGKPPDGARSAGASHWRHGNA